LSEGSVSFQKVSNDENWINSFAKLGKLSQTNKSMFKVRFTGMAQIFAVADSTIELSPFYNFDDDNSEHYRIYGINPMKKTQHVLNIPQFEDHLQADAKQDDSFIVTVDPIHLKLTIEG